MEGSGRKRKSQTAWTGKGARGTSYVIVRRRAPPVADEIAALRCVELDPLGEERGARLETERMTPRRVDIVGMGWRIGEGGSGCGGPYHIRNEGGRPGVITVFGSREDDAVLVVYPGPALFPPARVEPKPPIFADPLPEPLFAFLVFRQFGIRVHDGLPECPPFA